MKPKLKPKHKYGEIIVRAAEERRWRKIQGAPRCPWCGAAMEKGITAGEWWCTEGEEEHRQQLMEKLPQAWKYQEKGGVVTWVDMEIGPEARKRHEGWDWVTDEGQGVILAVAIRDERPLAWFCTTRGGFGKTYFKVQMERWATESGAAPPEPEEWVLAEWLVEDKND